MCWNLPVSLSFSVLYASFIVYYYNKKPNFWKGYIMFCSFYLVMEVFQSLQWMFGDLVHEYHIYGPSICSTKNKNFTYTAFILIWLQPLLF